LCPPTAGDPASRSPRTEATGRVHDISSIDGGDESAQYVVRLAASTTISAQRSVSGFEASPEWSASYSDGALILSGGADQLLAVEGVDSATASEIARLWSGGPQPTSRRGLEIAGQLADLGIVRRTLGSAAPFRVAVIGNGDLGTAIRAVLAKRLGAGAAQEDADLVIFVRTAGRLVDVYADGVLPKTPHLLIDAAYHHTFSIGPLVVPGDTACIACLAGRIAHRWGDPPSPERPAVQRNLALLAEIAMLEVERIANGDLGLAGQTVAYDFERRRVVSGIIYRLPWCPVCGDDEGADGRIQISDGGRQ
jgi:bacteriocin biosynthesis cyclodehydratase domain-containing protein